MNIRFDASNIDKTIIDNSEFGNEHIRVTNQCLYKDGKPWLPVMGEMQYSRFPEKYWRRSLRLMKEGGIDIVASYVFWNHHEEEKGNFRFDGNLNIRKFVKLCAEEGMYFFLRVGPWVHGEARNGGFPDWLVEECAEACKDMKDIKWPWTGVGNRKVVEPYMTYAKQFMHTIYDQVRDLQEHIIGIQLDNEVYDAPEYLAALKEFTIEDGMYAPLMTATEWAADLDGAGLLPMNGGYPDNPWTHDMIPQEDSAVFQMDVSGDDEIAVYNTMDEGVRGDKNLSYRICPKMTCEMGPGIQITYLCRPRIEPEDIYALSVCYLARGVNLLGYYVYHGGYNPMGKYSTMQESTKGFNDYPVISYDFQAPIGDVGQIRGHYFLLKEIFDFCHKYGEILAPMRTVKGDTKEVRCMLRSDGKRGFLFVNNHKRNGELPAISDVSFAFQLEDRSISLPLGEISSGACFYIPVGFTFGNLKTNYVTAKLCDSDEKSATFLKIPGIRAVIGLENGKEVEIQNGMELSGTTIYLKEPEDYKVSKGRWVEAIEQKENTCEFAFCDHLKIEDYTKEYTVSFNKDAKYLRIYFVGNLAAVYNDGKFICDQYYYGRPWTINVSDFEKKEITLKIQPLSEEDLKHIYFSCPVAPGDVKPEVEELFEEIIYE